MKKVKNFILLLFMGVFLISVASCTQNKYNAVVYSKLNDNITDVALEKYIINIDSNETENPDNRTLIINNKELYDEIFKDNVIECEFTKDIICVYVYRSVYVSNDVKLVNINVNDNKASIEFRDNSGNMFAGNAREPYARWIAVKMDKLEITEVDFIKK